MVWPCFHAGTTSPAGTLRLIGKQTDFAPVWASFHARAASRRDTSTETKIARPTGSAAREPSLAGQARFSSLVAATSHGGLIRYYQPSAVLSSVFQAAWLRKCHGDGVKLGFGLSPLLTRRCRIAASGDSCIVG